MPELPEVETVRRQLDHALAGRTINKVNLLKTGRESPSGSAFVRALSGRRIESVARRAKLILWHLDDGTVLVAHLKMTGRFVLVGNEYIPTKHDRVLFEFDDGQRLVWSDVRQFGFLKLVNQVSLSRLLDVYGPEPLSVDERTLSDRLLRPKTRRVKAALLNQAVIAGIGNIYADEICHRAHVRPTRRLGSLTVADRLRLVRSIRHVLRSAVARRGSSVNDYVDANGQRGSFVKLLRVYGREGKPCRSCKTPIKKIVLNQRGTHYCPTCQR